MTDFTKILDKAKELEAKMKESQEKIGVAEKRIAPKGSIPGQRIIAKGTHKIEIQETTLRIVKTHRVRKLLHHKSKKQEEPKINPRVKKQSPSWAHSYRRYLVANL